MHIPEADWKKLKGLSQGLLQRASQRVLDRVQGIIANQEDEPHKKYLKIWRLLKKEDKEIAYEFDDMKRSTAMLKLISMVNSNLITEDELNTFTEPTRKRVKAIQDANKAL